MILSKSSLAALVENRHATPHDLLGMHLVDGDVVVRALLPEARAVVAVPLDDAGPSIPLRRLGETDVFEGQSSGADGLCTYELDIQWSDGKQWRTRDPYSFAPTINEGDLYPFGQGDERRIYDKLGAHPQEIDGVHGIGFAVWAPNARRVSVKGDFNHWRGDAHPMRCLGDSGVWELFIPNIGEGVHYKFDLLTAGGEVREKTDPVGFFFETAPNNAAIARDPRRFDWHDHDWMAARANAAPLRGPMSIYELHLGSWRRKSGAGSLFSYRELAGPLVDYVRQMGFTHVEFLPVAEHPYYPSWGYQVTGFFAPTSRYGAPDDFQFLVNALHEAEIGVIIDWVPAHFPRDDWALARFDGTPLYEHPDPQRADHPEWGTLMFDYGKREVRNFLVGNALYWCDMFHVDGLRVDAVASMLYLDYARKEGEWTPNECGDNRNLEAVEFFKHANHVVHTEYPGAVTIAEESTDWPRVTCPPAADGLGFSFKWDLGWMNDTLDYFQEKEERRRLLQGELTFAMVYHNNENYLRPLSHDEVVHEKRSLLGRMPGDDCQRFSNLRALLGYQWCLPGKQLLFMGGEIGQPSEWDENAEISWELLEDGVKHAGVQKWVEDLNRLYREESALWEADFDAHGFFWIDCQDGKASVISFVRQNADCSRQVLAVLNLAPVPHRNYRIGLPRDGWWREALNSDAEVYGGGNCGNGGGIHTEEVPWHNQPFSGEFLLPSLACLIFQRE